MGTTFSVAAYGDNRARLESAARAALDEAQRIDRLLSNYRPDSEWSRLNHSAAAVPVRVSAELFDLLSACARYSRESDDAFDITVGPLMKMWGFYKGEGSRPSDREIAAALEKVGWRHVLLDASDRTVHFDRAGVELDPGGIGKGYAVDRMVEILKHRGIASALVSAGGSSIYGLGTPPGEPGGWRLPIRDPRGADRETAVAFLENASISTSGGYERFFRADGRVYSHLMDPRTGYPPQGVSAVSVVAPLTIDSEAWTKPYFVNGRTWTAAHRRPAFRVFFCGDENPPRCEWMPQ